MTPLQTTPLLTNPPLTLDAFRLTSDVAAMVGFLEVLGLRLRVSSLRQAGGGPAYAVLAGAEGRVTLHHTTDPAAPGTTRASVDTADLAATVTALTRAGRSATSWDEAFGRAAQADTPRGPLWIGSTGPDDDAYGYARHTDAPGPIAVELGLPSVDLAADTALLGELGARVVTPGETYRCLAFDGGGYVGLSRHEPPADDRPADDRPADDRAADRGWDGELGFATTEDGDDLLARLRGAGFAAELTEAGYGPIVRTTDPDGRRVDITLRTPAVPTPAGAAAGPGLDAITVMVDDPSAVAARLATAFGWEVSADFGAFAEVRAGDRPLLWLNVVGDVPEPVAGVILHWHVADVAAATRRARAAGAEILREPTQTDFGMESAYARVAGGPIVDLCRPVG